MVRKWSKPKVSEKEMEFRKTFIPDISKIVENKCLVCTSCNASLQLQIAKEKPVLSHSVLGTLQCEKCRKFYGGGEFSVDEDGSDKYCRWCGQGGTLYLCSKCPAGFCKKCIKRNLASSALKAVESPNWKCYCCDVEPLYELRALCWAAQEYPALQKKNRKRELSHKKDSDDSDSENSRKRLKRDESSRSRNDKFHSDSSSSDSGSQEEGSSRKGESGSKKKQSAINVSHNLKAQKTIGKNQNGTTISQNRKSMRNGKTDAYGLRKSVRNVNTNKKKVSRLPRPEQRVSSSLTCAVSKRNAQYGSDSDSSVIIVNDDNHTLENSRGAGSSESGSESSEEMSFRSVTKEKEARNSPNKLRKLAAKTRSSRNARGSNACDSGSSPNNRNSTSSKTTRNRSLLMKRRLQEDERDDPPTKQTKLNETTSSTVEAADSSPLSIEIAEYCELNSSFISRKSIQEFVAKMNAAIDCAKQIATTSGIAVDEGREKWSSLELSPIENHPQTDKDKGTEVESTLTSCTVGEKPDEVVENSLTPDQITVGTIARLTNRVLSTSNELASKIPPHNLVIYKELIKQADLVETTLSQFVEWVSKLKSALKIFENYTNQQHRVGNGDSTQENAEITEEPSAVQAGDGGSAPKVAEITRGPSATLTGGGGSAQELAETTEEPSAVQVGGGGSVQEVAEITEEPSAVQAGGGGSVQEDAEITEEPSAVQAGDGGLAPEDAEITGEPLAQVGGDLAPKVAAIAEVLPTTKVGDGDSANTEVETIEDIQNAVATNGEAACAHHSLQAIGNEFDSTTKTLPISGTFQINETLAMLLD